MTIVATPTPHDAAIGGAQRRQTMIDSQLRTVGVIDTDVLAAMATVPREDHLPARLHGLAYADAALEVTHGRWLLEPMVLALLLQNARVTAADNVLVVGGAGGYSAAVLRHIGARVTAIESDPALLAIAGTAVIEAPLGGGFPAGAPYDLVLFEGAIEVVPAAIASQVAPHGRVAAVVRDGSIGRAFAGPLVAAGTGAGSAAASKIIAGLPFLEVAAKPLPGFTAPKEFAF